MKKLLSLLGSISLIASTSGVAVSCGASNTRIATPTLNGDRARELIAKLADSSDFGFTFGDLFSDIDITTTIVNEINRFVSINYNFATTNNTLGTLGLNKYELTDGGNKDFETRFDNIIRTVAEDSLFNEYSKTIVDGPSNSFEMSLSKQLYSLNPIADNWSASARCWRKTLDTYYVAAGKLQLCFYGPKTEEKPDQKHDQVLRWRRV
jgi:hypothetical protein